MLPEVEIKTACGTCGGEWLTHISYDSMRDTNTYEMRHLGFGYRQVVAGELETQEPDVRSCTIGLMVEKLARETHCLDWSETGPTPLYDKRAWVSPSAVLARAGAAVPDGFRAGIYGGVA